MTNQTTMPGTATNQESIVAHKQTSIWFDLGCRTAYMMKNAAQNSESTNFFITPIKKESGKTVGVALGFAGVCEGVLKDKDEARRLAVQILEWVGEQG